MAGNHLQYFLLAGACGSLLGLGFSGLLVSRAQTENERRRMRLASIVAPHLRRTHIEISAFTGPGAARNQSFIGTIAWLFGFDPEKTSLYPTRWWIILIGTFAVAKFAQYMTEDFLGSMSLASLPIVWVVVSRQFFGFFEKRRQKKLLHEFPDALAMIVRAIRVGIPLMEAIRGVSNEAPSSTASEFGRLVDQVAVGVPLEDGVNEMGRRTGLSEYRFFATTLSLQAQTGGTLSETLEGLADVIRKRAALKAKGRAMTSEARSSAMILAMLPFGTGLLLWLLNPAYIAVLFTDAMGKSLLGLAVIMLSIGLLVIRAIIKKVLP